MRGLKVRFATMFGTLLVLAEITCIGSVPMRDVYAAPGSWSPAASLSEPRVGHSAITLLNGRALVSGPDGAASLLYDPATGTWNKTGNSNSGASLLTRLNDGKILAVSSGGGVSKASSDERTVELFDPASGTWSRTANMSHGRQGHTATLLKDGHVLVVGGMACVFDGCFFPPPWWYVPSEIFDPSTNTWTRTGDPSQYLEGHNATLLNDGRVLVAGCPSEVFVPATGTWTRGGNMVHCHGGTATRLADGRVLVVGGPDADLYDPVTETWSATSGPADARVGHTSTLLSSGNVLVAGGLTGCEVPQLNTSEEFNPGTGAWVAGTLMVKGRYGHTATLLNDGRVLIAGGVEQLLVSEWTGTCGPEVWTETAEIYTP